MKHNTFDGRDLLKSEVIGGDGTTVKTARAAQVQKSPATTVSGDGYAHLTPDEAAFVDTLVDHMLRVDAVARKSTQISRALNIDSTLAGNWSNRDQRYKHRPQQGDAPRQVGVSRASLYRVGIAATNLYCKSAFGELFDQISDSKQKGVLRLLDSIKFVFQDGSDAGVFFAIAYQIMIAGKSPRCWAHIFY